MSKQKEKTLLNWTFSEFAKYNRSTSWYFFAFLVISLLFLYSVKQDNFLFAVIIVMVVFIIINSHKRDPIQMKFAVLDRGVSINKYFYPYSRLNKFWIVYNSKDDKKIYFEINNILRTHIVVPIDKYSHKEIRDVLLKHIEEDRDKEGEPVSEAIARILKF